MPTLSNPCSRRHREPSRLLALVDPDSGEARRLISSGRGKELRYRELIPPSPRPPGSRTGPIHGTRAASTVRPPPPPPRTPFPISTRVLRARANTCPFAGFPFSDGPSHRSGVFGETQTSRNGEGERFTLAWPGQPRLMSLGLRCRRNRAKQVRHPLHEADRPAVPAPY